MLKKHGAGVEPEPGDVFRPVLVQSEAEPGKNGGGIGIGCAKPVTAGILGLENIDDLFASQLDGLPRPAHSEKFGAHGISGSKGVILGESNRVSEQGASKNKNSTCQILCCERHRRLLPRRDTTTDRSNGFT